MVYSRCSNPSTAMQSSITSPCQSGTVVRGSIASPSLRCRAVRAATFPRKRVSGPVGMMAPAGSVNTGVPPDYRVVAFVGQAVVMVSLCISNPM